MVFMVCIYQFRISVFLRCYIEDDCFYFIKGIIVNIEVFGYFVYVWNYVYQVFEVVYFLDLFNLFQEVIEVKFIFFDFFFQFFGLFFVELLFGMFYKGDDIIYV